MLRLITQSDWNNETRVSEKCPNKTSSNTKKVTVKVMIYQISNFKKTLA